MKKNLLFLAGLLFVLAVEIFVVADSWQARRPSPGTTTQARAPSK